MNRRKRRALCLFCGVRQLVRDLASDPKCPTDPLVLLGTGANIAGSILANQDFRPCELCNESLSITAEEIRSWMARVR